MTEDEMVGYHPLNGYEFEQNPGDSKGHKSLECCSLWGWKEWDVTQRLNSKHFNDGHSDWCESECEMVLQCSFSLLQFTFL